MISIVIDTNVLVSGLFFGGVPFRALEAFRSRKVNLIVCGAIMEEYARVCNEFHTIYPAVDPRPFIELITAHATWAYPEGPDEPLCADPDDDKFLLCALTGGAEVVVSGDKHLLEVSPWRNVAVLTPGEFARRHLAEPR